MAKVGIMHSGSKTVDGAIVDGANVEAFQTSLAENYKGTLDYVGSPFYARDLKKSLPTLANQLLDANVDILVAAGGSRSAAAASTERGKRNPPDKPAILFTSAAPYVCDDLAPNMTGVCAQTSDHDVARLNWLIQTLLNRSPPFLGRRIGVLRNSDRGDHQKQMQDLRDAVHGSGWHLIPRDIKTDQKLKESFDWLKGDIHALLVLADPLFNVHRNEAVHRTTLEDYPAIFQWREFVELGGLMSYGPNIKNLYMRAGKMAAEILNTGVLPGVWDPTEPDDFELVVNGGTAGQLGLLPLPAAVMDFPAGII